MEKIPVFVYAHDAVTETGIVGGLRGRPEVQVVEGGNVDEAVVGVVAAEDLDEETLRVVRAMQRNGCPRLVLVLTALDESGVLAAVEAGASGLLRRRDATPESLTAAIQRAARGDGTLPPDLLGRLLSAVGQLQRQVLTPRGLTFTGLTTREVEVLRLVADGLDTAEIAGELAYSERTIKNVIHDITMRLNLRNRTHAVAYALRQGLI
ncbi:MAG TPA: response regulator transcription factor [Egibacteraceae bacterium]|jgi:DNA-binding NarL/FixJ family response regulator|nr:response regulator transcription factor [Egibacteraceae bacterium]